MSEPNYLRTYGGRRGANVGPSRTCCWVEGEKPYGDKPFCDAPSLAGYSYCEKHKEICLRAPDAKLHRDMVRGALKLAFR